jgi:hypothetical protein
MKAKRPPRPRGPLSERFERYVNRNSTCWEWTGHRNPCGYGMIRPDKKSEKIVASRAAWMLYCGPIPDGLCVLHTCDNRGCVNPAHLFLGTVQDNTDDMIKKGRDNYTGRPPRG